MKGKPKSTRQRGRTLHTPPAEVVGARAAQKAWWAGRTPSQMAEIAELSKKNAPLREFERNGKMPAHQPARPHLLFTDHTGARFYETEEDFAARRRRLATRRAGKKFI